LKRFNSGKIYIFFSNDKVTTKAKEKMTDIILFDSARKGGTGKSKIAFSSAVEMAQNYGKTLLVEADFTNPNYFSIYSNPNVKSRFIGYGAKGKEQLISERGQAIKEKEDLEEKLKKKKRAKAIDSLERKIIEKVHSINETGQALKEIEKLEKKDSYCWFKDNLDYLIKKKKNRDKVSDEIKDRIMSQIRVEKNYLNDAEIETEAERIIDAEVAKATMQAGIFKPHIEDYILNTKITDLDILMGKKNQNDLLNDLIYENMDALREDTANAENMLKDDFITSLENISQKYANIIIDGYAGHDYMTDKLFELSNKHIIIAESNEASAKSVYNNMYETINKIFESMINKNSAAASAIASKFNISMGNKTGLEVYKEIAKKAKDINAQIIRYESKKRNNEEIFEGEEGIYASFSTFRYELSSLIEESDKKINEMTSLCIVMNKIVPDFFGKQRGLAIENYNRMKKGLERYGIKALTPGFEKNYGGGIIYFYKNLSCIEDKKSAPMAYAKPRHEFSVQIKNLVNFIKSEDYLKN
jgi:hypothetical protein